MDKIYTTTKKTMATDLLNGGFEEVEIKEILGEIFSNLKLGTIPGAILIGNATSGTIVGDELISAKWNGIYGITMLENNLYKDYNKQAIARDKAYLQNKKKMEYENSLPFSID